MQGLTVDTREIDSFDGDEGGRDIQYEHDSYRRSPTREKSSSPELQRSSGRASFESTADPESNYGGSQGGFSDDGSDQNLSDDGDGDKEGSDEEGLSPAASDNWKISRDKITSGNSKEQQRRALENSDPTRARFGFPDSEPSSRSGSPSSP